MKNNKMIKNYDIFFSHKSDNWSTPPYLYKLFIDNGFYDPCPLNSEKDGLTIEWNFEKIFINPPYSKTKKWVEKAIETHYKYNNVIVFLIPSRTDTKYFQALLEYGVNICFIKGRLKFGNAETSAPFPSCLIELVGNGKNIIKKQDQFIEDMLINENNDNA